MPYSFQDFSPAVASGTVLASGEAEQIEINIRDHRHGKDGVDVAGAAWEVTSKGVAFSVASTDVGKLFNCHGDFQVDMAAAATLGANFGAAFKNMGSGRIVLAAAAGQYIENNSYYALVPGEAVIMQSTGAKLFTVGGYGNGPVRLARVLAVGSLSEIKLDRIFPADFAFYELRVQAVCQSVAIVCCQWSQNSGSSYLATGYADTDADTTLIRLWRTTTNSAQAIMSIARFVNNERINSLNCFFSLTSVRGTAGTWVDEDHIGYQNSTNYGKINGIRVFPNVGSFGAGTLVELYGQGRPRDDFSA